MKLPALILILTLTLTDVLAAPPSYINTYVGEDGRSYYKNPLYCSYTSLYNTQPYNSKTTNYVTRSDQKCCTYSATRNSCCLDTKTNQCKCDPAVDCGSVTTSAPSTTTESLTASARNEATTTTVATTAASSTVADTTAATTKVADTTATTTRVADTTATTKVADTTAATTKAAVTTAATTKAAVTTAATTKAADTTTVATTKVADTTAATTKAAVTTAATTKAADTTTVATTKIADTTVATTKAAVTTTVSSTIGTTTAKTTAVSTTTSAPTTTGFKSLCTQPTFRILNGDLITDDCPYSGIANITSMDGAISSCNAIFTVATVNGTVKPTFLTAGVCNIIIEETAQDGSRYDIQIGNQRYPITSPQFTLYYGPNGTAFIDVNKDYMNILDTMGPCQKSACAYDKSTMDGLVDFTNCTILSWGTSNSETFAQNGLYAASVTLNQGGCADIPDLAGASNTMCFKATSGRNLICSADSGAPVYCSAYSNKEWILIGVAVLQTQCDSTPEVKVLPFPG